jgi:hypothetical protein
MTTRQYVTKSGDTWEWEETPEVVAAVKQLHKTIAENKQTMPVTITE